MILVDCVVYILLMLLYFKLLCVVIGIMVRPCLKEITHEHVKVSKKILRIANITLALGT